MSQIEAATRIREIAYEIRNLLHEAMDVVGEHGDSLTYNRAQSYWYPHMLMNLGGDHSYLGSSMCSMEDTALELEAEPEGSQDEEEEEPGHDGVDGSLTTEQINWMKR